MSNEVAIRVEGLSKAYRIGLQEQRHETLAAAFASFVRSPFENYRNLRKLSRFDDAILRPPSSDTPSSVLGPPSSGEPSSALRPPSSDSLADIIWALKDVSFEVKAGEVVGIIGRNGAGKSTLLKILSRITEPTSGRAEIFGRVASLLEVGTGFHPDLTGRENIYLNGTILGMRKIEIDRKLDEMVAFAEVEKFIDTPVKRYSSGMRMRLAFAVAAHLDPEILIVDEVLAVGDLNFQRKCLGKMGEIARLGRTVLFVSHNMAAVVQLCQRGIVLEAGAIRFYGTSSQSVDFHVRSNSASEVAPGKTNGESSFADLRVNGSVTPVIGLFEPLNISVTLRGVVDEKLSIGVILEDASGARIFHDRWTTNGACTKFAKTSCALDVSVPNLFLAPGLYSVFLGASFTSLGCPVQIFTHKLPLEIRGDSNHLGRTLLVPKVAWSVKH